MIIYVFNYFKLSININKYDQFTDIVAVLTKWAGSTFNHQDNQGQAVNHQDEYTKTIGQDNQLQAL